MKKQFLVFILLIINVATSQAEFVEQYRSEPNRRFAKPLRNILASDEYFTRDLNGNGVNDRFHLEVDLESSSNLLTVYDGLSKTPYLQITMISGQGSGDPVPTESISFNFCYLKGNMIPTLILKSSGNEVAIETLELINILTSQVEFSASNARFLGVANIDNDLVPEIFYFDLAMREIVIIEWKGGGNTNSIKSSIVNNETKQYLPLNKSSVDYALTLKYESSANTTLVYDESIFESVNELDLNDDGIMDIVLALENQNNEPAAIAVLDGETKNIKWAFQYPENQLSEFSDFHGFYDINGTGEKEAVFGNRTVVTADKNVYSLGDNFEFQAVYDVDNDGYPDLIGIGLQDSTVQVWGIESPSGVSDKDLIAAGFQLKQNYPNPFNPSTKISWQSPISSWQVLKVFDVLGNEVATLVNEEKQAGSYEVDFDATGLSSGIYFYKLQAGSINETKKMILLR